MILPKDFITEYNNSDVLELGEFSELVASMLPQENLDALELMIENSTPEDTEICCFAFKAVLENAKAHPIKRYLAEAEMLTKNYLYRVKFDLHAENLDIIEFKQWLSANTKSTFHLKT